MSLAQQGKVISIKDDSSAIIDVLGELEEVLFQDIDITEGDHVVIFSGVVVEVLGEDGLLTDMELMQ